MNGNQTPEQLHKGVNSVGTQQTQRIMYHVPTSRIKFCLLQVGLFMINSEPMETEGKDLVSHQGSLMV